jgi:peptidoglycan/xylan/chitin deacetylase (PgdA/CDA1 family)
MILKSLATDPHRFFATHARGSQLHSFVDFNITGTTTQIARQRLLNLRTRRIRRLLQQLLRHQQKARGAVATLRRTEINALPEILEDLLGRGYEFATLSDLVDGEG